MALPSQPVTLSVEKIAEINHKLSKLRHDVNNNLLLIMASAELLRYKPEMAEQMTQTLIDQPPKVTQAMNEFTTEFEDFLGITR
jgi:hypothetical protein